MGDVLIKGNKHVLELKLKDAGEFEIEYNSIKGRCKGSGTINFKLDEKKNDFKIFVYNDKNKFEIEDMIDSVKLNLFYSPVRNALISEHPKK